MWDDLYFFWWIWVYNRYWYSEQIAEWMTIYNTKISWKKIIWNAKIIFIRQRESFFYWIEKQEFDWYEYNIMSKERAFIQALREDKKFNELPKNLNKNKLLELAKKNSSKKINEIIKNLCI